MTGLQKILEYCKIETENDFWTTSVPDMYYKTLVLVQNNGRPGDWTIGAKEGLHRLTASIIRTLACELDTETGYIVPYTITSAHFANNSVGIEDRNISGPEFRKKMFKSTFDSAADEESRLVAARVSFFKKSNLNGCEAAHHLRARSLITSNNKKHSIVRCPLSSMAEFLGKQLMNLTFKQANYRIHFNQPNPTNLPKSTKKEYAKMMTDNDDDFDKAFPVSDIITGDEYQAYLREPLGEGNFDKARKLFGFPPIEGYYLVPEGSEAHDEIQDKNPPSVIYPPFLPTVASNGIDVGKDIGLTSRFHPDSVKAAILAPPVYAWIMSAYLGIPLSAVMNDASRISHVNYYLRFHNRHRNCGVTKNVHYAYREWYNHTLDEKHNTLCHKATAMLGMLDFVLTTFNAYLSIEAEKMIDEKWDKRRSHFQYMGLEFSAVFANIGNTKAGRDYDAVITILGMIYVPG